MTPIERTGRILAAFLAVFGSARASDLSDVDVDFRLWAAPEGFLSNSASPFAPAEGITGLGNERGRGEADLRLRRGGLTAELSARSTAQRGKTLLTEGVVNQLFYDADTLGQHFTIGKKVMSWDVGFGYRPLDVVQQEDRRALYPFALEGIPLVAWEWFGKGSSLTLVYANPLRGRAPAARDDESVAIHHYSRLGSVDLYNVARYSERTQLENGAAVAVVLGEALELHGSARYQRRSERPVNSLARAAGAPLAPSDPTTVAVSPDVLAALAGFTVNPGWGLSVLGEAWLDPAGGTADEWAAQGALAERQGALLTNPAIPSAEVQANLAWGMRAFDRPNLLRENLLLRVSWKGERLEPAVDFLFTPEDGGWAATVTAIYVGERTRLDAGLRIFGGKPGSAFRLFPESAIFYVAFQVFV
jgi:hypothetical protein